ncbi:hypothetical protein L1987_19725 [Smallanthus sonchifolius]|uniref:Uncharacterized protein n=1 Tax=Smallanthus sonchifolius TaxID=185202 RepID=A0ACB9IRI1_9ASTR|nr:hypothetical protein L1987_19725 [Smallanthus sonchifolius]
MPLAAVTNYHHDHRDHSKAANSLRTSTADHPQPLWATVASPPYHHHCEVTTTINRRSFHVTGTYCCWRNHCEPPRP